MNFKLLQIRSTRTINKDSEIINSYPSVKETRKGICSKPKRLQERGPIQDKKVQSEPA